jgi:hypothetical protein
LLCERRNELLRLPYEFPAHDYKGDTVSTVGEETRYDPRLQVKSVEEYVDLMSKLNLPNPKMMDVAVPANIRLGLTQDEIARKVWAVTDLRMSRWGNIQRVALKLLHCGKLRLMDIKPDSRDKHPFR